MPWVQASFKALNIESDDESEDEIDNTKEIQIEEALKLYQTALRLHSSQKALPQAGEAYKELFNSDIFRFAESQSEYARVAAYESHHDANSVLGDDFIIDAAGLTAVTDNAPSTLPQILHLSFKNRAQYRLDLLCADLADGHVIEESQRADRVAEPVQQALVDFAEALDKDEENTDVWRRVARLAKALDSCRIARFCLETALERDDNDPDDVLSMPNFEKRFDQQALYSIYSCVHDDLMARLVPRAGLTGSSAPARLHSATHGYEFLPDLRAMEGNVPYCEQDPVSSKERTRIEVEEHTVEAIAEGLLKYLEAQNDGRVGTSRSSAIILDLPPVGHDDPFKEPWDFAGAARNSENIPTSASSHRPSQTPASESRFDKRPSETPGLQECPDVEQQPSPAKIEPPRKRSADVAGLIDVPEGERGKSRRTRARKSVTGDRTAETSGLELTRGGDPRHEIYLQADRWLFELMRDVLRRMDVRMVLNADDIRRILGPHTPFGLGEGPRKMGIARAVQDLYNAMLTWNVSKTQTLTDSETHREHRSNTDNTGLLAFLNSNGSKGKKTASNLIAEVDEFVRFVNEETMTVEQACLLLCQVLLSEERPQPSDWKWAEPVISPYIGKAWSDSLKHKVERIITIVHEELLDYVTSNIPAFANRKDGLGHTFDFTQAIFELHLEMYARDMAPASHADHDVCTAHKVMADQWCRLTRDTLAIMSTHDKTSLDSDAPSLRSYRSLILRHLWASVFYLKTSDEITRDYLVQCINDLKQQVRAAAIPNGKITLPNNEFMSEISDERADREIIKLDTMDFFLSIFREASQHPVDLIEKLEPILIPTTQITFNASSYDGRERRRDKRSSNTPAIKSKQEILSEFVTKADSSLRLTLWYKLRDSYAAIDFPTKVLFVNLRILEVLVGEIQSYSYARTDGEDRERVLLRNLHDIHDILIRTFAIIESTDVSLDCLDISQVKTSTQNLVILFTLLHAVSLFDDHSQAVQQGPLLTNPFRAYASESFHPASIQLHSMQLHTFILIYRMMAEAAVQLPERIPFAQANVDRYEYLQYVHYALGVRRLCKSSDNLFLRFMREELNSLHGQPTTDDMAQILYDLYDLKCFTSAQEKQDHGCEPDYLDRNTAMGLVDFVLDRTQAANVKDLPKADLGKSIEKLQSALGASTTTFATSRNKRIINLYMKSPVSPLELFHCLKGVGSLSTTACSPEDAPIASKGWYFLIGIINLAKHKRSRDNDSSRISDDVNTAVKFLTHDLEYDADKWETWYRLGHGYDWLHEEECLWQADKLNAKDVVQLQRSTLHSYSQAVALALRHADNTADTQQKLASLHLEFATRVYSSARPPFSMQPFSLNCFGERLQSAMNSGGTYGQQLFQPLTPQQALRVAATLCRRAITYRPAYWLNHFVLGKCLWKMFLYVRSRGSMETELAFDALDHLHKACEVLDRRRDPNRTEPTLEPIYKVVFIVEKMVSKQLLSPAQGAKRIAIAWKAQKQVDMLQKVPELESGQPFKSYAVKLLKMVRQSDKQKWHHRVVYKIAHLTYDSLFHTSPSEAARQAKDYLDKQNMYSNKTAALAVWKPENERPGRHWVFMTRYARFVTKLLDETDDLEFLQLFARRIRRKTSEFSDHTSLWEYVLDAHLRVHRRHQRIPNHAHSNIFSDMNIEQFRPRANAVDSWCADPDTKHPLVDMLREIEEIKKVNNKLASDTAVDDLICDTYAQIFFQIGKDLPLVSTKEGGGSVGETPAMGTPEPGSGAVPEKPRAMALANVMNVDGSEDGQGMWRPVATSVTVAGGLSNAPLSLEPAPRTRAPRSVTRRDVLKRAAGASVVKATAAKDGSNGKDSEEIKALGGTGMRVVLNMTKKSHNQGEEEENKGDAAASDASSELSDPEENADDEMEMEGEGDDDEEEAVREESPAMKQVAKFPGLSGRRSISKAAEDGI